MNDTNDDLSLLGVVERTGCHSTMAFPDYSQISETTCAFPEGYTF